MNLQNFLNHIESLATNKGLPVSRPSEERLDIELQSYQLLDVIEAISIAEPGYLIAITGMDPGVATGQLIALYHYAQGAGVVTLRVNLPRENPTVPSITNLIPAARIFEQELQEVLGITIIDPLTHSPIFHKHLFLADDWPEGVYPLRKDFRGLDS